MVTNTNTNPTIPMLADAHIDTISRLLKSGLEFGARNNQTHADLDRLLEAGVRLQICALFTMPTCDRSRHLYEILRQVAYFKEQLKRLSDKLVLATSADEVVNLCPQRLTVVLSVEGGEVLAGDLSMLDILYDLGVRSLTLTWNHRNELADGVGDTTSGGGLTRFGKEVVAKMTQLGMIVDVSHLSEAGFWDVMEVAEGPVIASHSNAKALCNHQRNLSDDQLRALAAKGGYVGLNFCPPFLTEDGNADIEDIVRHAIHIAEVAGPEVLGFGTDFDGISGLPAGIKDVTSLPEVVRRLSDYFSPQELAGIAGGNLQRVLSQAMRSND